MGKVAITVAATVLKPEHRAKEELQARAEPTDREAA
jgi:hypothetical protein